MTVTRTINKVFVFVIVVVIIIVVNAGLHGVGARILRRQLHTQGTRSCRHGDSRSELNYNRKKTSFDLVFNYSRLELVLGFALWFCSCTDVSICHWTPTTAFAGHRHRGRPQAWARGGTCSPLWKCCKVLLCISSYSRTLSRRIIYALFSQPVVGFWGESLHTPPGLHPWTPLGDSSPICPPLVKILQAPMIDTCMSW